MTTARGSGISDTDTCLIAEDITYNLKRVHTHAETKYKIDYTQEWVMCLCNPRVCGYPEAKPRDKCKQVGYCA